MSLFSPSLFLRTLINVTSVQTNTTTYKGKKERERAEKKNDKSGSAPGGIEPAQWERHLAVHCVFIQHRCPVPDRQSPPDQVSYLINPVRGNPGASYFDSLQFLARAAVENQAESGVDKRATRGYVYPSW